MDLSHELSLALADPARRVGGYVLLGELGRGGMGVVYRAWDEKAGRVVSLKRLLHTEGPEDLARFEREVQALRRIQHPNVVEIRDAGETGGKPWLVMDYVEGKTLARRLHPATGEERIPLAKALEALCDVAFAVQHAHEKGVIHRDLKPENVIIDGHGRGHVLDFGLARVTGVLPVLTRSFESVGTVAYMPPEQTGGGGRADDWEGEIADETKAIDLDPTLAVAWGNRAAARVNKGDLDGAIADLERFLELAPGDPGAPAARQKLADLKAKRGH